MNNPLVEVEDRKTWTDMGKQAYLVYKGAREAGASIREAKMIVREFHAGIIHGATHNEQEKNDD